MDMDSFIERALGGIKVSDLEPYLVPLFLQALNLCQEDDKLMAKFDF